jgi:ATP-dependent protease HslVU (ClpYQ) ATPase subunit
MSWVITAVVASTAASVYTSSVSAKAQQAQIKDQMKQEELAAKSEELARREQLNAALAANAIDVAQSGVDAATFASLSLNSARQAGLAEGQEELSQRLRQAALQRKSRNVGAIRDAQIASTLLSTPLKYAQAGGEFGD